MIEIGLTTWSEHPSLLNKNKITLAEYSSKLPVVEIDTPFYGIPTPQTTVKWVSETPKDFGFILKGHQSMTTHSPWQDHYPTEKEMYERYFAMLEPLITSQKLRGILLQFPASFNCTAEAILHLKRLRKIFSDLPVVIEFRHPSWYEADFLQGTLAFMKEQEFILMVVDEPQLPGKSIPFYPIVTNKQQVIFRCHGRYQAGWTAKGDDWRKKRTLYRYNEEELTELANALQQIEKDCPLVTIIFNNNSGGDAAANALTLKEFLGINYEGLNPEQMDLF
ncbi:DUF72 domain-containing protein [Vagococcus salmoninarum]|uniref:DUF72 domain-containing protein n=1 Tax=Vagococcus salmoninarum TaxID=2739 RepID=UPI0028D670D5|nr:DUF72 domain-containing protein [Vagococcus salmoninarum]